MLCTLLSPTQCRVSCKIDVLDHPRQIVRLKTQAQNATFEVSCFADNVTDTGEDSSDDEGYTIELCPSTKTLEFTLGQDDDDIVDRCVTLRRSGSSHISGILQLMEPGTACLLLKWKSQSGVNPVEIRQSLKVVQEWMPETERPCEAKFLVVALVMTLIMSFMSGLCLDFFVLKDYVTSWIAEFKDHNWLR